MPIANCIVSEECEADKGELAELWSRESGISSDEMTVNILIGDQQFGKSYKVMATLYLPTAWSMTTVSKLQIGLANALSKYFCQPIEKIHIITSIVESGLVVETGKEQTW